jgi:predicted transcriptional regulator
MNFKAVKMMQELHLKSSNEIAVLWALCAYSDKDGVCFPSYETLAEMTKMHRVTVINIIKSLCERGIIEKEIERVQRLNYNSNRYKLSFITEKNEIISFENEETQCLGGSVELLGGSPRLLGDEETQCLGGSPRLLGVVAEDYPKYIYTNYIKIEEKEVLEAKKKTPSKKGTRLDDDWKPSELMKIKANEIGYTGNLLEAQIIKFVNYWTSKTGSGATKLDWQKTFHNWLLNDRDRYGAQTNSKITTQPKKITTTDELRKMTNEMSIDDDVAAYRAAIAQKKRQQAA